ncbi:Uncharacterized protein pbN1_09040 [Aromatoleum bremense]|nr:Uncharacterized protein pbN1_09040 [Aromatoleum bremense]
MFHENALMTLPILAFKRHSSAVGNLGRVGNLSCHDDGHHSMKNTSC